jgi:drug/metabolite transporter (DMT)-like permease
LPAANSTAAMTELNATFHFSSAAIRCDCDGSSTRSSLQTESCTFSGGKRLVQARRLNYYPNMNALDSLPLLRKRGAAARAIAVLSLCCVFWGFSFPAMKLAVNAFENQVVSGGAFADAPLQRQVALCATINAWRFGAAAVLFWLITKGWRRRLSKDDLLGGTLVGLGFAAGMTAQIIGLHYTLPSISSFLTALVVIFSPLAQAFVLRQRVNLHTWAAVVLATAGMIILAQPDSAQLEFRGPQPPFPYAGEILTILGSLFFTAQILAVDHYGKRVEPVHLTLVLFVCTAVCSAVAGACFGAGRLYEPAMLTRLVSDHTLQWTVGFMVLFSSILAMHWMNAFQPHLNPAIASVVYCLEPIFGTFFSIVLGTEVLARTTVIGGAIILVAVLVVTRRGGEPAAVSAPEHASGDLP